MEISGLAVAVVLASLTLGSVQGVPVTGLPPCDFPAIYNFGDSNSDTGGRSAAFLPIPAPNGLNFFGKPAGRDSDGRLIIDFIAELLGFPYLSAYLNSIGPNFRHGANFATGGSTILRPNETIYEHSISPFYLDMQISHYAQFKQRTTDLYSQVHNPSDRDKLPRSEEYSRALYTFDIGQNDLTVAFRTLSDEQLLASIPDMINQFGSAVQNLYKQGARAFWIHNTGPIGCLPVTIVYAHPNPGLLDPYGCVKGQNDKAIEFNRQLKARVVKLRTELPQAALTYVDVYAAKYKLISNAKNQGFTDPMKICCGYHEGNTNVWCGFKEIVNGREIFGAGCPNPSDYVSWDGVHYTQTANQWVANHILNGSFSDPPIPITLACHRNVPPPQSP